MYITQRPRVVFIDIEYFFIFSVIFFRNFLTHAPIRVSNHVRSEIFLVFQSIQVYTGGSFSFLLNGHRSLFPEIKHSGREVDYSTPLSTRATNEDTYSPHLGVGTDSFTVI